MNNKRLTLNDLFDNGKPIKELSKLIGCISNDKTKIVFNCESKIILDNNKKVEYTSIFPEQVFLTDINEEYLGNGKISFMYYGSIRTEACKHRNDVILDVFIVNCKPNIEVHDLKYIDYNVLTRLNINFAIATENGINDINSINELKKFEDNDRVYIRHIG